MSLAFPKPRHVGKPERRRIRAVSRNAARRLELRADAAVHELVRQRARGYCEISAPTATRGVEVAHGLAKGPYPSVRWDGRNLFWASREAHARGHREPDWWREQMLRILGRMTFEALTHYAIYGRQPDPRDVIAAAKRGRFIGERL